MSIIMGGVVVLVMLVLLAKGRKFLAIALGGICTILLLPLLTVGVVIGFALLAGGVIVVLCTLMMFRHIFIALYLIILVGLTVGAPAAWLLVAASLTHHLPAQLAGMTTVQLFIAALLTTGGAIIWHIIWPDFQDSIEE